MLEKLEDLSDNTLGWSATTLYMGRVMSPVPVQPPRAYRSTLPAHTRTPPMAILSRCCASLDLALCLASMREKSKPEMQG